MAIDFPNAPIPGDKYNPGNGSIYTWDGVAWNLAPVNVATARTRNRVTNPVMQISQENGSTGGTVTGFYPADQWTFSFGGLASGSTQRTATTSPEGSPFCVAIWSGAAKPSLAATDYLQIVHPVEGFDIADFQWGTAKAKPVVLRFAATHDTPGTYSFTVANHDGTRTYAGSFTIAAAGVWQVFSFAIPGDTTGTWKTDSSLALTLHFVSAAGSSFVGVAGWQGANVMAPPGCTNGVATANKGFLITDVGLYLDPDMTGIAPPFVAPEFKDDYTHCMRYWEAWRIFEQWDGAAGGTSYSAATFATFKVTKRVAATVAMTNHAGANYQGATAGVGYVEGCQAGWAWTQGNVVVGRSISMIGIANARM